MGPANLVFHGEVFVCLSGSFRGYGMLVFLSRGVSGVGFALSAPEGSMLSRDISGLFSGGRFPWAWFWYDFHGGVGARALGFPQVSIRCASCSSCEESSFDTWMPAARAECGF